MHSTTNITQKRRLNERQKAFKKRPGYYDEQDTDEEVDISDDNSDTRREESNRQTVSDTPSRWAVPESGEVGWVLEQFLESADKYAFDDPKLDPVSFYQPLHDFLNKNCDKSLVFKFIDREKIWTDPDESRRWTPKKVEGFINWIWQTNRGLLEAKDRKSSSKPLMAAILEKRHVFVECILQKEDIMLSLLTEVSIIHGTCLHKAISEKTQFVSKMMELSMKNKLLLKTDESGNNPMHKLVQHLGEEMDPARLQNVLKDEHEDAEIHEDAQGKPDNPDNETRWTGIRDRLRWLKEMIDSNDGPAILELQNQDGYTPYQLREKTLEEWIQQNKASSEMPWLRPQSNDKNGVVRRIIVADPIANYIRVHCIRDMKLERPDDIVKFLYRSGDEKHTDFDLAGYPKASIKQSFLDKLANHLYFESILRYVALPNLFVEPSKQATRHVRSGESDTNINTDLRAIFDWLRRNGVRRIIKVTVVDYGEKCHRDSVIIQALKGFRVEYLTWKKIDISSDVIARSSDVVKEVSLYWSGNKAILMGWASQEGFNNKKKFPKLETIRLFVKGGYDDSEILKAQINRFKKQMEFRTQDVPDEDEYKKAGLPPQSDYQSEDIQGINENLQARRPNIVRVIEAFDNEEFNTVRDFSSNEGSLGENPWISSLKSLTRVLQNAKGRVPPKIAIIDNGVDATWPSIHGKIVKGRSFCPYPNSNEFINAYFVPNGQHGTLVADLICKSCPTPQLYIARMEERSTVEGGVRFTTASAIKAIEWAIGCKVDIICMSWTVDGGERDGQDIRELQAIIEQASANGILMFGSASDQGPNTAEKTYPGGFGECFRIGAASDDGVRLPWVNELPGQFLFPGKQLPFYSPDRDSYFYETGSSFSTAFAVGLAGVLLSCDSLLGGKYELKKKDRMEKAFGTLSKNRSDGFVNVRENLVGQFWKSMHDQGAEEMMLKIDKGQLASVMDSLLGYLAPLSHRK
ncbi:hypothetical protein F4860DRAFT_191494 [Xylaria cubensis]|nr:hypothetical protein F4860DRAFT_191494 [Xylaria cubensis]